MNSLQESHLTEQQHAACYQYFVRGVDQHEVAHRLGIKQPEVSKLIARANERLRKAGLPTLARPRLASIGRPAQLSCAA